jgi:hypothetical protein
LSELHFRTSNFQIPTGNSNEGSWGKRERSTPWRCAYSLHGAEVAQVQHDMAGRVQGNDDLRYSCVPAGS